MLGLLIDTCGPSLLSSSNLFSKVNWRQRQSRTLAISTSSSCSPTRDIRPALESQVLISRIPSSCHDHESFIAAQESFLLSREASPPNATSTETQIDGHVDHAIVGEDHQRQMDQPNHPRLPIQKQESSRDTLGPQRRDSVISPTSATSGMSMPTPQLTFTEATVQAEEGLEEEEDDEELSGTPSDAEEDSATGSTVKSAAERLAEKRKMKRFRLTHSQTRFLMSEFSRQPHPDATQRERLSKDIPGLSPRQVQVWFQNRRAKMKRLTGDDQERIMRSRALPTGFDPSRTLRPASSEQLQSPSALDHLIGPNTNLPGGSPIGRPISRSDRRDMPPINMTLVYHNPQYSMNSTGGSSNVSSSTSISSANQSPLFTTSPNSSPFLRSGGDGFSRTLNTANLGFPAQGSSRARSGSLMSLPPTSPLSSGSPLVYPRESLSMENIQAMYQTQYDGSDQEPRSLNPQLGDMGNLQVHSLPLLPGRSHQSAGNLARRNSSSTLPSTMLEPNVEGGFESHEWFNLSSNEQLPHSNYQFQAHQIRRRQTQPTHPTQQYQPSGIATLSLPTQRQGSFSSTVYPHARQSPPIQQSTPYAPSTAFPTDASFMASPTHPQSSIRDHVSHTNIYHPSQQQQQQQQGRSYQQDSKHPGYHPPSSQGHQM